MEMTGQLHAPAALSRERAPGSIEFEGGLTPELFLKVLEKRKSLHPAGIGLFYSLFCLCFCLATIAA